MRMDRHPRCVLPPDQTNIDRKNHYKHDQKVRRRSVWLHIRSPTGSIDRSPTEHQQQQQQRRRTEQTGKWSKMVGLEISCLLSALYIYLPLNANAWTTWVWNFSMPKKKKKKNAAAAVHTASSGLDKFFFFRQLFLLSLFFCIALVVIKCPRNRFEKRSTFESTYPIQKV